MARGSNKREGRAARSELPSGVEATRADIGALQAEKLYADRRAAYAEKFEEKSEFKSFGKVNAGDGQVGNGIIKNGTLFLRDEDIDEIVASNFGESDVLQELIRDGGGSQPFALFVGENNLVDPRTSPEAQAFSRKTALLYNNEMGSSPIELPDADDYDVDDFEPGEPRTWEDPGSSAYGTLAIGDSDADSNLLRVAYEKVSGVPVDVDSVRRLSAAITNKLDKAARAVEEDKSESFDWDEYQRDRRSERYRDED